VSHPAATALGMTEERAEELVAFKDWLIDRLTRTAAPE
jgi:hypothetical protein